MAAADVLALHETLSNWGRWGDDDQLGALNLITPGGHRGRGGLGAGRPHGVVRPPARHQAGGRQPEPGRPPHDRHGHRGRRRRLPRPGAARVRHQPPRRPVPHLPRGQALQRLPGGDGHRPRRHPPRHPPPARRHRDPGRAARHPGPAWRRRPRARRALLPRGPRGGRGSVPGCACGPATPCSCARGAGAGGPSTDRGTRPAWRPGSTPPACPGCASATWPPWAATASPTCCPPASTGSCMPIHTVVIVAMGVHLMDNLDLDALAAAPAPRSGAGSSS